MNTVFVEWGVLLASICSALLAHDYLTIYISTPLSKWKFNIASHNKPNTSSQHNNDEVLVLNEVLKKPLETKESVKRNWVQSQRSAKPTAMNTECTVGQQSSANLQK